MDLGTLIKILVKRWYVVLPVVALTMATAFQVGRSMKPDYQARGAVLIIGSNTAGGDEVNPLAELRSPLNTTALAISLIAADEQTRVEIRGLGFQGTYSVDVTPATPIINVRVRAQTPEQALLTLEAVIEAVELKLDERQRGVEAPENSLIQTEVLTRTTTARAVFGSRDRAVTVVAGLGLVAAASAAIIFNSLAVRRERVTSLTVADARRNRGADYGASNDLDDDDGSDSANRTERSVDSRRARNGVRAWTRERLRRRGRDSASKASSTGVAVLTEGVEPTTKIDSLDSLDSLDFMTSMPVDDEPDFLDTAFASATISSSSEDADGRIDEEGDRVSGVGRRAGGSSTVESSDER